MHHDVLTLDEDLKLVSKQPSIFNVIMQSIERSQCLLVKSSLQGADIIVSPNITNIRFGDFNRARECIKQGEMAAQNSISKIKEFLK